jgi:Mrp family chromosome partitioning ATPase
MNHRLKFRKDTEEVPALRLERLAKTTSATLADHRVFTRPRLFEEEATQLVYQLFLGHSLAAPGMVVFAGMNHGNGCSEVCATVAEALALDAQRPVCLVEANFRSPFLSRMYQTPAKCGLSDALDGRGPIRDYVVPVDERENLWLLPIGNPAGSTAAQLASDALRDRLSELRDEFDNVLIDAPPIAQYADALALGQLADGLVLVVEAGATRRDETAQAVATLRNAKIPILAAVLNKLPPMPARIYHRL